jgi:hypothetical protein
VGDLYYICAILDGTRKFAGQLFSDSVAARDNFARHHDREGVSVYESVNPLQSGAKSRCKETVAAIVCLQFDIDLRSLITPREKVLAGPKGLTQLLPLEVRESGGGFHVIIWLKEPAERGTPEFNRANELRLRLTTVLSADQTQKHEAAILRRLGSHNTKYNGSCECRVIVAGKPVDLTEIENFLDQIGDAPKFQPVEKPKANGHDGEDATGGPVDVDQRFADMQFEGPGLSGIHITKLHCTASMLNSGWLIDDIVSRVDAEVHRVVDGTPDADDWDWDWERRDTERMCYDLVNKDPSLAPALGDQLYVPHKKQTDCGNPRPQIVEDRLHHDWHVEPWTAPVTSTASVTAGTAPAASWPTPYSARPSSKIPRRKWLWGTHYFRGGVTITAAPGATGKSQHSLVEAVGMAAGRDLITGEAKKQRLKVWVWNAEDDVDEMERAFLVSATTTRSSGRVCGTICFSTAAMTFPSSSPPAARSPSSGKVPSNP